jgi:hypothetical protein
MLLVIMCGEARTQVSPESRETLPKQFHSAHALDVSDGDSMLDDPLFETPVLISNFDYRFLMLDQLEQIGSKAEIVLEPMRAAIRVRRLRLSPALPRAKAPTRSSSCSPPITSCRTAPGLWRPASRRWRPPRVIS